MQSQGPGSPSKPHCNIFPTTPAPTSSLPPTYLLPCLWPFAISKQSMCLFTQRFPVPHGGTTGS